MNNVKLEELEYLIKNHMVFQTDLNFNIQYVNDYFSNVFGYREEEVIGKSILNYVHSGDLQFMYEWTNNILKNLENNKMELRIRKKDNRYVWVKASGTMLYNNNKPESIAFIFKDIIKDKIVEEKLEDSEDRFRSIYMESPIGIVMYDDKFNLIDLNDAALKMVGDFSVEDLKKKSIFKSRVFNDDTKKKLLDGESVKIKQSIDYNSYDIKSQYKINKTGVEYYNFFINPLKNKKGFIVQIQNITESIIIQQKLEKDKMNAEKDKISIEKSRQRYKELIEALPDAIIIRDKEKIIFANDTAVKMLKAKDKNELIGRNPLDFVHDDYKGIVRESINKVMKEKGIYFYENKIIDLNGNAIDAEIRLIPVNMYDKNLIMVVGRDITELKKAEMTKKLLQETLENERLRTEFFANLSHELRTPINVIYSALQVINILVKNINSDYNLNKYYKIIKQNCHRLIRLVNNLIDVTKIDAGYFEVHMTECDIVKVIENIVDSVAEYVKNKNINICFDTNIEEKNINCDLDAMERIMLNLISNAVKFGHSGGNINVKVSSKNHNVTISVKDDGIGIAKEQQKNIFERFIRVDKSLNRNVEGSGIGLSLVKSLVEMQNGKIFLKSQVGKGSEFTIIMPENLHGEQWKLKEKEIESDIVRKMDVEFSDIYY